MAVMGLACSEAQHVALGLDRSKINEERLLQPYVINYRGKTILLTQKASNSSNLFLIYIASISINVGIFISA